MKKILLTLVTGLCFGSLAMAQEPTKATRQKAGKTTAPKAAAESAAKAKVKAKEDKAKAFDAGKIVMPSPAQPGKAALTDPRSN